VLWDIGANIGIVTVYAAIKRNSRVVAFEPGAANYFVLNRNIEINNLIDRVTAYCIAVAPKSSIDLLYTPGADLGSVGANFGAAVDYQGKSFESKFKQGMVGYSLSDLVASLPFPQHIKLDVDGLKRGILMGGLDVFADCRLKSAMIELDVADRESIREVAEIMRAQGFTFTNEGGGLSGRKVMNAIFERRD
jgi:FkbM family methyltransferase